MAVAAIIAQIIGRGAAAIGTYRSELGKAEELRFQAAQAANNAELARQDQMLAAEAGAQERAALSKQEQQVRGAGRAAFAGGNVRVDEGTALDFDIAQAEQFAAERERSRDEQRLKQHRLETERQGLLAESRLKRRAARRQKKGAALSAVGTFASGIGGMFK